jgi:hypothetical protein
VTEEARSGTAVLEFLRRYGTYERIGQEASLLLEKVGVLK